MTMRVNLATEDLLKELLEKRSTESTTNLFKPKLYDLESPQVPELSTKSVNTKAKEEPSQKLRETLYGKPQETFTNSSKQFKPPSAEDLISEEQSKLSTEPSVSREPTSIGVKPENIYQQMDSTLSTIDDLVAIKKDVAKSDTAESKVKSDLYKKVESIGKFLESDSGQEMLRALVYATNQPGSSGYKAAEYLEELHQADLLNRAMNASTPENQQEAIKHMSPETTQLYLASRQSKLQEEKTKAETENIQGLFEHELTKMQFDRDSQMELLQYQNYAERNLARLKSNLEGGKVNPTEYIQETNTAIKPFIDNIQDTLKKKYGTIYTTPTGELEYKFDNPLEYQQALFTTTRSALIDLVNKGYISPDIAETHIRVFEDIFAEGLNKTEVFKENGENLNTNPYQLGPDNITIYHLDKGIKRTYLIRGGQIEPVSDNQVYIESPLTEEEFEQLKSINQ